MIRVFTPITFLIAIFYFLAGPGISAYAQQSDDESKAFYRAVESEYLKKKYENAYDEFEKLGKKIEQRLKGQGSKKDSLLKQYLDWGIRLSFLAKEWSALDRFIGEYNELEPKFSIELLSDNKSPQLRKYINNFLNAEKGNLVYVNKHPQNVDLAPATITVYKKEDIERLGARDLLDLIRLTAGFAEIGDNNERVFGTRGSSNTTLQDVLFLVNGHRLTDVLTSTNAPDWISLDYVEQLELVKGPGSALYGGSAFSGVVNIITKSGTEPGEQISVNVGNGNSLRDLSNQSIRVNYQVSKELSNSEFLYLSASFKQSDGTEVSLGNANFRDARPDLSGTGEILRAADTTGLEFINQYRPSYDVLTKYTSRRLSITGNIQSSSYVDHRPISFNLWESQSDSAKRFRGRVDSRQFVQLEYDLPIKNLSLKLSGDHFHKKLNINSFSTGIEGTSQLEGDELRGTFNLEYVANNKEKHSLIVAGLEGFINNWRYSYLVDSLGGFQLDRVGDQFTNDDDSSRNEYIAAFYFQTEQHLIPETLVATLGVRINYHNEFSRLNGNDLVWGTSFSPRAALVFIPKKDEETELEPYKIKLIYNSAFLPPPFLYRRGGIEFFAGRDTLQSQIIESGELVVFGDINKNLSYSALTYHNKIDQNIERDGDGFVNSKMERRVSGYEFELKYKNVDPSQPVDWFGFANFSLTTQSVDSTENRRNSYLRIFDREVFPNENSLVLFPRSTFKTGLNAFIKLGESEVRQVAGLANGLATSLSDKKIKKLNLSLGANLQWLSSSFVNNSFEFDGQGNLVQLSEAQMMEIPSAVVLNVIAKLHFEKFNIGASIFNLTDKEYFLPSVISRTNRQRAEGRAIFLDFTYQFK